MSPTSIRQIRVIAPCDNLLHESVKVLDADGNLIDGVTRVTWDGSCSDIPTVTLVFDARCVDLQITGNSRLLPDSTDADAHIRPKMEEKWSRPNAGS